MMRRIAALAGLLTVVACSGPAPVPSVPSPSPSRPPGATATTRVTASPAARPRPVPPRVTVTRTRMKDGSVVTLAAFAGPVTYVLHDGSEDPGLAAGRVRAGPAVRGAERRRLLAAFNGGFKLSAGAGGYEQEGHVISPLIPGMASLVIDRSGAAAIGVWGHGLPRPGEAVESVRQNLTLLVNHGQVTAAAADWGLWGATLGGGEFVARSALGQDAAGQLIFAGSMSANPADLAAALIRAGAVKGMELDINPQWVQLDVAGHPGHALTAAIPGQQRPADQYLIGWIRDFITVLAPP
jgi:hypothetical protein